MGYVDSDHDDPHRATRNSAIAERIAYRSPVLFVRFLHYGPFILIPTHLRSQCFPILTDQMNNQLVQECEQEGQGMSIANVFPYPFSHRITK